MWQEDCNIIPVNGTEAPPYDYQDDYANMRAALYGLLAAAIKAGMPLPRYPKLLEELSATTKEERPQDNRLLITPKKLIKQKLGGSPDWADSLSLLIRHYSDLTPETYVVSLRDLKAGRVTLSNAELLDRYADFYNNEPDDNGLFRGSLLDNQGDQYEYNSEKAWGPGR